MPFLIAAATTLLGTLIAHGLAWSTTHRRIGMLRALSDLHAQLPPDRLEARDRVAREIDRSSESLSEWLGGAERRSTVAFGLGALVVGQVALIGAQALLTSTQNLEESSLLYSLRSYALPLAVLGILALVLGVMALVLLPILQWAQRWLSRGRGDNNGDVERAAVVPAPSRIDETQRFEKESNSMTDEASRDDAYLEHAVWLLEWHERRSEAFATRSVGLLGFVGVLIAFVLQLATRPDFDANGVGRWALGAALLTLAGAAIFAFLALGSVPVDAPGIAQLRRWWRQELESKGPANVQKNIIERFLVGTSPEKLSPLDTAAAAAAKRARRFRNGTVCLLLSLGALAVVVSDVVLST